MTGAERGRLLAVSAILLLGACGAQPAGETAARAGASPSPSSDAQRTRVAPPKDGDLCAALVAANVPEVRNDDGRPGELVLDKRSTTAGVNRWLARQAAAGGPSRTVADFDGRGLDGHAEPGAALSACVFKVDPRPISMPPELKTVPNGVSVFMQGSGAYVVEGIGPVAGLVERLGEL